MTDASVKLAQCFAAVFPDLAPGQIQNADHYSVKQWDSVASVTLFATIEETFAVEIDLNDLIRLTSYSAILDYLNTRVSA